MDKITPVLDIEQIKEKANEAAQKGAIAAIEDFYNSYNSPYKKAIAEKLEAVGVDTNFDIPDIIAVLNEKMSQEIDTIANTAVAKTFIPMVKSFLTRENANIKFSDILEKFIEFSEYDQEDNYISDYSVTRADTHNSDSLNLTFPAYRITNGEVGYELHLYNRDGKTTMIGLPYLITENGRYSGYPIKSTMKISLDGATLEMPFTRGVLENEFVKYCARLVIGNNDIEMDCEEFSDEMFPEEDDY